MARGRWAAFPRWLCAPGADASDGVWVPLEQEGGSRRPGCWPRGDAGDGAGATSTARAGACRGCFPWRRRRGFPSRRRPCFRPVGGTARGARGEGANSAAAGCPSRLCRACRDGGGAPWGDGGPSRRRAGPASRGPAPRCARSPADKRASRRAALGNRNRACCRFKRPASPGLSAAPPNLLARKSSLK